MYLRFDLVGKPLPQDESNSGENHHSGTHGPNPETSCLGLLALEYQDVFRHGKASIVKGTLCCNNLTISVFPLGSRSWVERLAQRISWDQGEGSMWLAGLGGKQSMLCVSILQATHLTTTPNQPWYRGVCVQKGEHFVRGSVETGVKWHFGSSATGV